MLDPSGIMLTPRAVVGPMDEPAFIIELVFAPKLYSVSNPYRDSFGKVDVMENQDRLAGFQLDDESLMTSSVGVVRINADDFAMIRDHGRIIFSGIVSTG